MLREVSVFVCEVENNATVSSNSSAFLKGFGFLVIMVFVVAGIMYLIRRREHMRGENIEVGTEKKMTDDSAENDRELFDQYRLSPFYIKYKDTYVSDIIERDVFGKQIDLHRMNNLKSYSEVYQFNLQVMRDILNLFAAKMMIKNRVILWKMTYAAYIDPDSYEVRVFDGIPCTADGLLSINRIYTMHGMTDRMINEYARYRRIPVFFFPRERGGINTSRAGMFGDRIDHTLFDLKRYYEGKSCKLAKTYELPKTSEWLKKIGSFKKLVDYYKIKGIFVNDKYEVYDLEKGDESIIRDYQEVYSREWSKSYYNNLKKKIDGYMTDQSPSRFSAKSNLGGARSNLGSARNSMQLNTDSPGYDLRYER